ncbi:MFS transporter [Nocardioides sp. Kera G14]|uniref:MFS transporter n=1 Tax=Nocardioides sp. Kera G14 TaxID=2884264 RepID=UPI001D119E4E|nr:MFS transporter [Nocardioides sp. Kera G14]UDY23941.1 MFS transporter [Nocardioides sp. Kera G14]
MTQTSTSRTRPAWLVVALCWLVVIFDGYDLIVYGTTIPSLLGEKDWHLTPDGAGHIGSLAFLGMLVGALSGGAIADILGRRLTIITAIVWFSLFTGLTGFADGPGMFGLLRFVAGLGLGALVPSSNAIAAEFVKDRHRSIAATAMMSGVPVGGSIAAIIGLKVLTDPSDWPTLYFLAFAGLALAVLVVVALPESPTWLRSKGRAAEADVIDARYGLEKASDDLAHVTRASVLEVFKPAYVVATLLFFVATTATMFAWYGLGTWLPKLTKADVRFDLGSDPLTYLLALNLGAVAVSVVTAWTATRFGALRVAIIAAFVGAISLAVLTTFPSSIAVVYLLLILAGVGSHGTLCLIISAIASHFPPNLRGTALGTALGGGRVGAVIAPTAAGWLLDRDPTSAAPSIVLFAVASGVGAVLLLLTYVVAKPASDRTVLQLAH